MYQCYLKGVSEWILLLLDFLCAGKVKKNVALSLLREMVMIAMKNGNYVDDIGSS
jgi:hypothetical protein